MLSETEKERIKTEERFRFEGRAELEKSNSRRLNSMLGFLNTNLGIFLLSSIFLSSFSWIYNEYKTTKDLRIKNQQEKTFLHYEIRQRLSVLAQLADTVSEDTKKDLVAAVHGQFDYSIRKDYSALSFSALLVKYETLSNDTINPAVETAIGVLNHFEKYEDQLQLFQKVNRQHVPENYYFLITPVKKEVQQDFLPRLLVFQ
jgi:hypothetical protein